MPDAVIPLTSGVTLNVVALSNDDYYGMDARFYENPSFDGDFTFEAFITEKRQLENQLRGKFAEFWTEVEDFEVGNDFNIAFTLCGGVYSTRPICRKYLEILRDAIASTKNHARWMYDTSVELQNDDGFQLFGFRLVGNSVFVRSDDLADFDVVHAYSK